MNVRWLGVKPHSIFSICVVALTLAACEPLHGVHVDVQTEYAHEVDFVGVRVIIWEAAEGGRRVAEQELERLRFIGSRARAADIDVLAGSYRVEAILLDSVGEPLANSDTKNVLVDGDTPVTVTIRKSCEDRMCPEEGDPADYTACSDSTCHPAHCESADLVDCPELQRECIRDNQCVPSVECVTGQCVDGRCFFPPDSRLCAENEYCEPDLGCTPLPCDREVDECLEEEIDLEQEECSGCSSIHRVRTRTCTVSCTWGEWSDWSECEPDEGAWQATGIESGWNSNCAFNESTGEARCWGMNANGQLGLGHRISPLRIPTPPAREVDWLMLSAGGLHSCGVSLDGLGFCWGDNGSRQLGMGDYVAHNFPEPLAPEPRWRHLTAGWYHTCGITDDAALWCWGVRLNPIQFGADRRWASVEAAMLHSCSVDEMGTGFCWGEHATGRLGLGSLSGDPVAAPEMPVVGGHRWRMISPGREHSCGINMGGELWCWGANALGQLGVEGVTESASPVRVGEASDWTLVRSGGLSDHSCGLRGEQLYCWGANDQGQLGAGTRTPRETPVSISPTLRVRDLAVGSDHTCVVLTNGLIMCAGDAGHGQLGPRETVSASLDYTCIE